MFLKKFKKLTLIFLLTIFIIPSYVFAYSNYIIASGKTVGIKLSTNGILIVGSYKIDGHDTLKESKLTSGDIITKINNISVSSIEDMVKIINECYCTSLDISYLRDDTINNTKLNLYLDDGVMKTGLYVKDTISGVGTLTYIDPNTKLFGVLGHEIIDNVSGNIISIKDGSIFDSKITNITRSNKGNPGEKNAILYTDKVNGIINKNTKKGIFGTYTEKINDESLYKVANIDEITLGDAYILTVVKDDEIEKFRINIKSVKQTQDKLKNIEFEIIDDKLLEITNGIVQGMSGSPIIQDDKIIGAVTHVVVDDPQRGYGILITNMLEEAEN